MTTTAAEVLDAAKALPRQERAAVVQELIATLGEPDAFAASQYAALREAVRRGINDVDEGRADLVPAGELRDYIRQIGSEAVASAKSHHG